MTKAPRSPVTTHVLDIQRGQPAAGVALTLEKSQAAAWLPVAAGTTDADGRSESLLAAGTSIAAGIYRLTFATGAYFQKQSLKTFYPSVQVVFEITDSQAHHHVPLLLSAFGYSTYRGT